MYTLEDYVRWVAESMGLKLEDETLMKITLDLLDNDKYIEVLMELEESILKHCKDDVKHNRSKIRRIK